MEASLREKIAIDFLNDILKHCFKNRFQSIHDHNVSEVKTFSQLIESKNFFDLEYFNSLKYKEICYSYWFMILYDKDLAEFRNKFIRPTINKINRIRFNPDSLEKPGERGDLWDQIAFEIDQSYGSYEKSMNEPISNCMGGRDKICLYFENFRFGSQPSVILLFKALPPTEIISILEQVLLKDKSNLDAIKILSIEYLKTGKSDKASELIKGARSFISEKEFQILRSTIAKKALKPEILVHQSYSLALLNLEQLASVLEGESVEFYNLVYQIIKTNSFYKKNYFDYPHCIEYFDGRGNWGYCNILTQEEKVEYYLYGRIPKSE